MPKQLESTQADLFEPTPPDRLPTLQPTQQTSLLEQIQTLLIEAITADAAKEKSDEQDRP
jgi:hypothetical protein